LQLAVERTERELARIRQELSHNVTDTVTTVTFDEELK